MTRFPYIPPTAEWLPVLSDTGLCVITTSNDPYEDNGDYDWSVIP